MQTTLFMFVTIAAAMTSTVIPAVYAEPNDRSGFGQANREFLAGDGEMGDHSRAGGAAGDPPFDSDGPDGDADKPGRSGIGNVRDALGVDHVSDIPDALCSQDPGNSACTSDDDEDDEEEDNE